MTRPPAAVLFDCDGVLADSEGLTSRIVAADLSALGWPMTADEAKTRFVGMSLPGMIPLVAARVGVLSVDWAPALAARIAAAMLAEVEPIPGALAALHAVAARLPVAVASNSARVELAAKLRRLGLVEVFGDRVLSFQDVVNPKPAPDIYRAAAAACGADPRDCVVVEDSPFGARAGVAAGCRVLGYAADTEPAALVAVGAEPFTDMARLPALLGLLTPAG